MFLALTGMFLSLVGHTRLFHRMWLAALYDQSSGSIAVVVAKDCFV